MPKFAMPAQVACALAATILLTAAGDDAFSDFGNGSLSKVRSGQGWSNALFVCDGVDQQQTLVFGYPDANGNSTLTTYGAPGSQPTTAKVVIGEADPGAGQIHYPVSGGASGVINAVNPGMVDGATSPTVSSVTLGGTTTTCRWASGTIILGITANRTVQITQPSGYQYQAFGHGANPQPMQGEGVGGATAATLTLQGGKMSGDAVNQTYTFTNAGYTYQIAIGGPAGPAGGTLTVAQGGKTVLTEPLVAYTLNGN